MKLPDPLSRRHLLEREMPEARALAIAEGYLEEERVVESLAFFAKAGAQDRLESLRSAALEAGDVFLLRETSTLLGRGIDGDEWARAAEAAERAGQLAYAEEARRQAAAQQG